MSGIIEAELFCKGVEDMFNKSEKKKKGPAVAIGIATLAVYGAYSMVSKIKGMTTDKISGLMCRMKKKKGEGECDCESEDCD